MGQYYLIANIDKKEYITTYDFGNLGKLMEFAYPIHPAMVTSALCILLADGNGRGGGDLHSENPIIGSWAHNRVVVSGDYADPNPEFSTEENIYTLAYNSWRNVSVEVLCAMADDGSFVSDYGEYLFENYKRLYAPAMTAMAKAHQIRQYKDSFYGDGKDEYPKLAERAEYFFEKLFPGKPSKYYQVINGIVKHSPDEKEEDMLKFENALPETKNFQKEKQIKAIKAEIDNLKLQLDILENL